MGATSAEEIQRQHEEAKKVAMILPYQCPPCTFYDEIPLSQKRVPTETVTLTTEERDSIVCVSSRARVDVSKLQDLVRVGYDNPHDDDTNHADTHTDATTNFWNPTYAATNNVQITRPSHDAWGIQKIVLIFTDDFLQDVYEMPWLATFQDALQPILDALQLSSTQRIVRLLLASLPPGVTIPIHHDSGEWVQHTHRVHVPILVNDPTKIVFTCGKTPTTMERVDCTPGHVFEMNNQAKHAVSNCSTTDYRVHLILDYVDQDFTIKRRILLSPGERLIQTRRSIDRYQDKGLRKTPSYMILGAQKAGTTSLYEYMNQHPLIIRPKRRETHALDWRWNNFTTNVDKQRLHCLSFYKYKELALAPSCRSGDSSPSYLLDSRRVIPRLKSIWPHDDLVFIVMLRDPVARAQSHYSMVTSTEGTKEQKLARGTEWQHKTLEQVIQLDMHKLKSCGLIPYWNIETGTMDRTIFETFVGSKEEDDAWDSYMKDIPINTGSHSLISRGMYELQLRNWYRAFDRKRILIIKLEDWKTEGVGPTMTKVWKHVGVPSYQVLDEQAKNTRSYSPMPDDIKAYLREFYDPHNQRLKELLKQDEWSNPWDYS